MGHRYDAILVEQSEIVTFGIAGAYAAAAAAVVPMLGDSGRIVQLTEVARHSTGAHVLSISFVALVEDGIPQDYPGGVGADT